MSEMESDTLREITPSLPDGHYTILNTIRQGRLYLAERAGKRFVLKTAEGAKGLELLKREYDLSIGLSHPFLAYVFTYEETSPIGPCIVQEYVDGRSLDAWLKENPSAGERLRVFEELLSVVSYLHEKGVIHNDLSPANILISHAGDTLKLIDLGFADQDAYSQKALGGTRDYASPELLSGGQVDARSDIYSLGRLMILIFPRRYRYIARRCLRDDARKRYPSVDALERALKATRRFAFALAALLLLPLLLWPLLRQPRTEVIEVPSQALQVTVDSLQTTIDSLQTTLAERDREKARKQDALEKAKARAEAIYKKSTATFRQELAAARTKEEAVKAWMGLTEAQKEVNFDLPASVPEDIRPTLRDYILGRNNAILTTLNQELIAKIQQLQ